MEISVQPRGFNVVPVKIPANPSGLLMDGMRVLIVDTTGIAVSVTFTLTDWESFQRFIADPVGESAAAEARAKIALPGSGAMAPSVRGRRH